MPRARDESFAGGSSDGVSSEDRRALAGRLHATAVRILQHVRAQDRGSGLTPARLSALSVLVFGGRGRSLGELAAARQVTPPTMSRLVKELANQGLVTREPHPEDGRSVVVRATEEGRRRLEAGRGRRVERLRALLARLEEDELEAVRTACSALGRALAAPGDGSGERRTGAGGAVQRPPADRGGTGEG